MAVQYSHIYMYVDLLTKVDTAMMLFGAKILKIMLKQVKCLT